MSDTDAVATTPRSQYLSCDPADQLSPRDPMMMGGIKGRAAGWQSPAPQLSPRNLKASALIAAAARGATPSPRSKRAASPAPGEAGPSSSSTQQQRPQTPRGTGPEGAPAGDNRISSSNIKMEAAAEVTTTAVPVPVAVAVAAAPRVSSPFAASAASPLEVQQAPPGPAATPPAQEQAQQQQQQQLQGTPTEEQNAGGSGPPGGGAAGAPTPQPSSAAQLLPSASSGGGGGGGTSTGRWGLAAVQSFAFCRAPLQQMTSIKEVMAPAAPTQAQQTQIPPPADESGSEEGSSGFSCESRDSFPMTLNNTTLLCPAPTAAPLMNRYNSLPCGSTAGGAPTQASGLDSVDSFACPATTLDFLVPVGSWRSTGLPRSNSCADPSLPEGGGAPRRINSRGLASIANSIRRRSRGSNSGDAATDQPASGRTGSGSSSGSSSGSNDEVARVQRGQGLARPNSSATFCGRWSSTEVPSSSLPETVLEVEPLPASPTPAPAAQAGSEAAPEVQTAISNAADVASAVRTAVAAVPAGVVAAVRQATSTTVGRRAVMVLSLMVLGGLWALVANLPAASGGVSVGLAVSAPAATAAAPATGALATPTATAVNAATKAATGTLMPAVATAATAAAAAAGFGAAVPGSGIMPVGHPVINAYLVHQGAAAVVAGYVDGAQLLQAAPPDAVQCASLAALPAAQLLCA